MMNTTAQGTCPRCGWHGPGADPMELGLDRLEDLAAAALAEGRRAARLLRALPAEVSGQGGPASRHVLGVLEGPRLLDLAAHELLDRLECDLDVLVRRETYWVPTYGSAEADVYLAPERRLTVPGQALAAARDAVAEALALSRRARDLVVAEAHLAKERGLIM